MFWVPQAGRLGIGISILSYAGKVYIGVATDAKLIPGPDKIIESFYEEIDLLLASIPADQRRKPPAARQEKPEQTDDLTQVHGLTPKAAELLNKQGIVNFDQLAKVNVLALNRILDDAGPPSSNLDPANWPTQARYLSNIQAPERPQ